METLLNRKTFLQAVENSKENFLKESKNAIDENGNFKISNKDQNSLFTIAKATIYKINEIKTADKLLGYLDEMEMRGNLEKKEKPRLSETEKEQLSQLEKKAYKLLKQEQTGYINKNNYLEIVDFIKEKSRLEIPSEQFPSPDIEIAFLIDEQKKDTEKLKSSNLKSFMTAGFEDYYRINELAEAALYKLENIKTTAFIYDFITNDENASYENHRFSTINQIKANQIENTISEIIIENRNIDDPISTNDMEILVNFLEQENPLKTIHEEKNNHENVKETGMPHSIADITYFVKQIPISDYLKEKGYIPTNQVISKNNGQILSLYFKLNNENILINKNTPSELYNFATGKEYNIIELEQKLSNTDANTAIQNLLPLAKKILGDDINIFLSKKSIKQQSKIMNTKNQKKAQDKEITM